VYGSGDLALAQELAGRAALAVDNARLYGEAQEAIRARDEFLSIASHELRTPVAGIKGYAQLLLRTLSRGQIDEARLARSLQALDDAADRLTGLTYDLLDVSRIRLGQLPLRVTPIDLGTLVRDVTRRFEDQLDDRHALRVDVAGDPCVAVADAERLEQVLANLLENAAKYSPRGGEISVRLTTVGENAMLSVRDHGIGLPADASEAIFEPFGRAANAAKENVPGMGLGLYICRDIVQRHGGRIRAESDGEGQGVTVTIQLPLASTPASLELVNG
jgi:signal transduction histidine kinase